MPKRKNATFGQFFKTNKSERCKKERAVIYTKIKITYESEQELEPVLDALKVVLPTAKLRKTAPKDGFLHTILSVPRPRKTTK